MRPYLFYLLLASLMTACHTKPSETGILNERLPEGAHAVISFNDVRSAEDHLKALEFFGQERLWDAKLPEGLDSLDLEECLIGYYDLAEKKAFVLAAKIHNHTDSLSIASTMGSSSQPRALIADSLYIKSQAQEIFLSNDSLLLTRPTIKAV
jgi:hypothetical protein